MTTANLLLLFVSLGSIDHRDTDLRLSPGGGGASPSRVLEEKAAGKAPQRQEEQRQMITIFYNGQICACDVTDIQAKAIIRTAKREMENMEAMKKLQREISNPRAEPSLPPQPPPPSPLLQETLLNRRLSMKRSLQRFLENRKTRAQDSSPYNPHQDV